MNYFLSYPYYFISTYPYGVCYTVLTLIISYYLTLINIEIQMGTKYNTMKNRLLESQDINERKKGNLMTSFAQIFNILTLPATIVFIIVSEYPKFCLSLTFTSLVILREMNFI